MIALALLCLAGIALLYFGAEWLVRGASSIARRLDVRPVIVGLTVVAFATSAPELIVSIVAGLKHQGDIVLGNILGSNVANVGLVLGLAALVRPLRVERALIRREVPVAIGAALLFMGLCWDGQLSRIDGAILLAVFLLFLGASIRTAIASRRSDFDLPKGTRSTGWSIVLVVAGLCALVGGGHLLVTSAVAFARIFGISELFIGLTLVAVGTSLPELATSVVASARGEDDLCVGNVVGSNIFNILLVLGIVSFLHPVLVPASLFRIQFPFLIGTALLLLPIMRTGFRISRIEGALLIAAYAAFIFLSSVGIVD